MTKRLIVICCWLLIGCVSTFSVKGEIIAKDYYIFSPVVNIRDGAGEQFAVTDQLLSGDTVTVLEEGTPLTIDAIKGNWLKISYVKQGKQKIGYLWQGNLSATQLRRGDFRFVFGIESFDKDNNRYIGNIKVIKNKAIINQRWFFIDPTVITESSGKVLDNCPSYQSSSCIELTFTNKEQSQAKHYYFEINDDGKDKKTLSLLASVIKIKTIDNEKLATMTFSYGLSNSIAIKLIKEVDRKANTVPVFRAEVYDLLNHKLVISNKKFAGLEDLMVWDHNIEGYEEQSLLLKDGTKLVVDPKCIKKSITQECTFTIKAMRGNKKLATYNFKTYKNIGMSLKVINTPPLDNVQSLFVAKFDGVEACGGVIHSHYFIWTGKEIKHFTSFGWIVDAGYSRGSTLVFFDDKDFANIVAKVDIAGAGDEGSEYGTYRVNLYQWDGQQLTPLTLQK